jgi:hypothetical protein
MVFCLACLGIGAPIVESLKNLEMPELIAIWKEQMVVPSKPIILTVLIRDSNEKRV